MVRKVKKDSSGRFREVETIDTYVESEPIKEVYFNWLCDKVCSVEEKFDYSILLSLLFTTEFTWVNDLDSNRAEDGLRLRRDFVREFYNFDMQIWDDPCNLLEMMVAFTYIMAFNMDGFVEDNSNGRWFWEMIVNTLRGVFTLTVDKNHENVNTFDGNTTSKRLKNDDMSTLCMLYTRNDCLQNGQNWLNVNTLRENIHRIVDRKYDRKGNGSFFPVEKCRKDLRKVEILYQFYLYCDEKYPI